MTKKGLLGMSNETGSWGPDSHLSDPNTVPPEQQAIVLYASTDSQDPQAREDIAFVLQHWEAFAASAWDCFKLYGRGALLFDRREAAPNTSYNLEPQAYVDEDKDLHWAISAHVEHYDPTTELVVVTVDTAVRLYRLRAQVIAPPEASLRSMEIHRTLAA